MNKISNFRMKTHRCLFYSPAFLCKENNHFHSALGSRRGHSDPGSGMMRYDKWQRDRAAQAFYSHDFVLESWGSCFYWLQNLRRCFHKGMWGCTFPLLPGPQNGLASPELWPRQSLSWCVPSLPCPQLLHLPKSSSPDVIFSPLQPGFRWFHAVHAETLSNDSKESRTWDWRDPQLKPDQN